MAVTPVHATKTVTTAGTRVQVNADATILPSSIFFEATGTNTGYIYLGLVTVSSTVYITRMPANGSWSINAVEEGSAGSTGIQLSAFWIDSSVNGETCQVTYMFEQG